MDVRDQIVSALYALRLVAVSVLPVFPVSQRVDPSLSTRHLIVGSAVGRNLLFSDFSPQSQLVRCLFGITLLPSEWRSISFGDQSGVS